MNRENQAPAVLAGVSLVCTIYNEAGSIVSFLESVFSMDSLPEEVVIVDGGSTDGTNELIAGFLRGHPTGVRVRHTVDPECNIRHTPGPVAKGRNIAIDIATGGIVAVTDGGCRLDPVWLEKLVAPLLEHPDVDVAGGWYLPDAHTRFERCVGRAWLIPPDAVDPTTFMPSSRSLALRRSTWKKVGGYPEHTLLGEDTLFNLALRAAGCGLVYVPDAIVYWKMPHSVRAFSRLVYRYGYGDGSNRILGGNILRVGVKIGLAAVFAAAAAVLHPVFLAVLAIYLAGLVSRHHLRSLPTRDFLGSLPCMVAVKLIADASYLSGYLRGRFMPVSPAGMAR